MKKVLIAAVITCSFVVAGFAADPLSIGESALLTDHEMQATDGSMVSYNSVKGEKGTLVIFSCNHCPYVKGWEDRMSAIGNWARENGIGVLYMNSNDPSNYPEDNLDAMKQRKADKGFEFHYVVDAGSTMAKAYGATKTPEVFLFDANDVLVYYGTVDDNMRDASAVEHHFLKDAVTAVSNGQTPETQSTTALGCTIKFYPEAE